MCASLRASTAWTTDELSDFVEDFAGLGVHYHLPFRTYSSGMRSRLAFGASMGIHFDTYLVDEVTAVGDSAFRQRATGCSRSGCAIPGRSWSPMRWIRARAVRLPRPCWSNGKLHNYENVEERHPPPARNMAQA